jgi:asparagine synthase (glutamine-hydrolysing)
MCGIVGFTYRNGLSGGLTDTALTPLLEAIFERGPDGEGRLLADGLAMGMRRLSVIDLAGGGQPLFSREGRVAAFQNGEIYNYRKLRQHLSGLGYVFRTESDTEVLAHGYDAFGIDGLVERLDGMFALAIFDRDTNTLHIARDRMGEKPLYYCYSPGRAFAYGSSLVQMAALPWIDDLPDAVALDRYLALHFTPGDRTLFRGIQKVLPGERLSLQLDGLKLDRRRYWRPRLGQVQELSAEALREMFERAVRSRMVADVPLGVFLSGGLDSAMVAASAAARHPGIDTFSMGFSDASVDESADARAVAEAIGSRHHEFRFDQSSFLSLLPQVAAALDEPIGDQALLPVYWLAKEARQHVTVVLAGEGADEAFGGYGYYREAQRALAAQTAQGLGGMILEDEAILQSGFPILSGAEERRHLNVMGTSLAHSLYETDLTRWLGEAHSPMQRAQAADMATWLPDDLLIKFDRMAMAHSLEGRAPFLSPELIQAGLDLPTGQKMSRDGTKLLLRQAARGLLPDALLDKPKQGFVLPMKAWLKEWFEAHGGPAAFFLAYETPGIDPGFAARIVNHDLKSGLQRERFIFALVMLHVWRRSFDQRVRRLSASLVAGQQGKGR